MPHVMQSPRTHSIRAVAVFGLLLLSVSGCASFFGEQSSERAERIQQALGEAQLLARDGRFEESIRLLEELVQVEAGAGGTQDADLLFQLGWLYDEYSRTEQGEVLRARLLEADRYYRATIESLPDAAGDRRAEVRVNLALVMHKLGDSVGALGELDRIVPLTYPAQLLRGDILWDRGERSLALEVYELAQEQQSELPLRERDDRASRRIVQAHRALLVAAVSSRENTLDVWTTFVARLDQFASDGALELAATACESVIRDCGLFGPAITEQALCRWVIYRAGQTSLTPAVLARLPLDSECVELESAAQGLQKLMPLTAIDTDPLDPEAPAVRALVADAVAEQGYWLAPNEVWRRYSFAHALQAIARSHALYDRPAVAALILEKAIEREPAQGMKEPGPYTIAPEEHEYDPGHPLFERIDVGLDIELDLALLFYSFHASIDAPDVIDEVVDSIGVPSIPEVFIAGPRLRSLVSENSRLATFSEGDGGVSRTVPEIERVHTVLGLVYAGWPDRRGWKGLAEYHFDRAIQTVERENERLERLIAEGLEPDLLDVPHHLRWMIGKGLSQGQALDAFTAAAKSFLIDSDDLRTAREIYSDARAAVRQSQRALLELERIVYPRDRFYLGGSFGLTRVDSSGSQLTQDLREIDPSFDVFADLDASAQGWKAYFGKRFNDQLEAELGYVALGGPESFVVERGAPNPALPDAVRSVHPRTADGVALSGIWTPLNWHRLAAGARLGAWYWDSDLSVDLQTAGGIVTVRDSSSGIDVLYGVKLDYQFDARFGLRAEYEFYGVDSDYVSFLSFGLTYLL